MRKLLLVALTALPLVGFCDGDLRLIYFRLFTYTDFDKTTSSGQSITYAIANEQDLYSILSSSTLGFKIEMKTTSTSGPRLLIPASNYVPVQVNGISSLTITNSVLCLSNGVNYAYSPMSFASAASVYFSAANLYYSGYRGPGVVSVFEKSNKHCVNINYPLLLADVLSSTNTLYRSILLSYLNSIQTSVYNIDTGVSQLRPVLDDIRDINTSTASNTADLVETSRGLGRSFDNVVTNTAVAASNSFTIAEFMPNILTDLDNLHNDASLQSLDVYLGDNTQSWLDFLQWAVDNNYIDSTLATSLAQDLQSTDPQRKGRSYSIPDAHRRFFVKNQIKHGVVEAVKLRGRYQSFVTNISNNDAARQGLQNMGAEFNHSVNYQLSSNHAAAMDWREQLRQDLQAWKTSDEHGILNIKKSIDDNFVTRTPASTNAVPFTAYVTNYVTRVLTNVIDQASADVQSNATANADRQIEDAQQRWNEFKDLATGEGDGLNVKIKFPLWESDAYHVNVRDDGVIEAIRDGVTIVNPELTHISDAWDSFLASYSPTNSLDWEPWFEKWIPFTDIVTNYYTDYNASAPASAIAADFLERGFDASRYSELPWFERVEVLLAMIADVRSNSVEVADIEEDMENQVAAFQNISTNVVSISGDVVGLFQYVQRFSSSLQSVFGDRASPLTGEYVLLPAGHWIGDNPLTLRVNPTVQNLCRLIMQCIWYLGFLVLLWVVVNWTWQKVVSVLRWLWSMFDV